MKTKLTPEQSQRLIELGVAPSKASATRYIISETEVYCGYSREVVVTDGYITDYVSQEPLFTLSDILSLLPRTIKYGNRVCCLKFQAIVSIHDGLSEVWQACYTHTSCKTDKEAPELIDALYKLLRWTLTREKK